LALIGDSGSVPLEGEDVGTRREDAWQWVGVYADLLRFRHDILDRVARDVLKLSEVAQRDAPFDLDIIREHMEGYELRFAVWYERVWDLQGLWIDPDGEIVRHRGSEVAVTRRESQLLTFMLAHPHRYFSPTQIMREAWTDSAVLPEEVRPYVQRLRKILRKLEVPCKLLNRPGLGYSLVFREN
jgi:hypothetical protein